MIIELEAEVKQYSERDTLSYVRLSIGGYMFFESPPMSKSDAENVLLLLKARDGRK